MSKDNKPVVDESYKATNEYLQLKAELTAFEIKDWRDMVWSEEIIAKYKVFYSFPIFSKIDMPRAFIGQTFYNFKKFNRTMEIIVEIMEKDSWKWFLISGKPGIGKSHLAIACMVKSMGESKKKSGKYDTGESIFLRLKENAGLEERVIEIYSSFDVLVIDELEAEKITSFNDNAVKGFFQEILKRRSDNKKQTIVIGNKSEEIKKIIGDNGFSRFKGGGEILDLIGDAWVDYRPKIKKEANTADTPF